MDEELERQLECLAREDSYRVDQTLKENALERTERVFLVGADGAETGPFVRKYIDSRSGLGAAYRRIWEAQLAGARFEHLPRIVESYDAGEQSVVVMEFVEGPTLEELVEARGGSPEVAAEVFPALCEAVRELHESFDPPMIHRDLKPSNVIATFATVPSLGSAFSPAPSLGRDTAFKEAGGSSHSAVVTACCNTASDSESGAAVVRCGTSSDSNPETAVVRCGTSTDSNPEAAGVHCSMVSDSDSGVAAAVRCGTVPDSDLPEGYGGTSAEASLVKVTIIDLGIARMYDSASTQDTRRFGTRAYAPPEQFGYMQTDVRSDVYALGMLLAFLAMGRTPSPAEVGSGFEDCGIPESLLEVAARATAFDPSNRYQSVAELSVAFASAMGAKDPACAAAAPEARCDTFDPSIRYQNIAENPGAFATSPGIQGPGPAAVPGNMHGTSTSNVTPAEFTQAAVAVESIGARPTTMQAPSRRSRAVRRIAHGARSTSIPTPARPSWPVMILGIAWDAVLAFYVLAIALGCISIVVSPSDITSIPQGTPLPVVYAICVLAFALLSWPALALCYRRPLVRFAPNFATRPFRTRILICVAVVFSTLVALFMLMGICLAIFAQ